MRMKCCSEISRSWAASGTSHVYVHAHNGCWQVSKFICFVPHDLTKMLYSATSPGGVAFVNSRMCKSIKWDLARIM
jgi:hypothetical protein